MRTGERPAAISIDHHSECTNVPRDNNEKAPSLDGAASINCGSYRDRTDDIHGVNVALYQLS